MSTVQLPVPGSGVLTHPYSFATDGFGRPLERFPQVLHLFGEITAQSFQIRLARIDNLGLRIRHERSPYQWGFEVGVDHIARTRTASSLN